MVDRKISEFNVSTSLNDGLMSSESNALETVIASTGVKVKVNAVWVDDGVSRFAFNSSGRLTYIGERNVRLPIDLTSTLLMAGGGDSQCEMAIAINGVIITATSKQSTVSSTKAASVTTFWQHEFATGDYIEAFVSNESNTTNIVVQQIIARIN